MLEKSLAGTKPESFEELALPLLKVLHATAFRLTRNPGDADDLVQETCLRACAKFHQFQPGTNCRAWMIRILMNTFFNMYRRRGREREFRERHIQGELSERYFSRDSTERYSNPEVRMRDTHLSTDVEAALDELPNVFRQVVVLADLRGHSYREIAKMCNTPVGTVMSRLFRARRYLRERLHDFVQREGFASDPGRINPYFSPLHEN